MTELRGAPQAAGESGDSKITATGGHAGTAFYGLAREEEVMNDEEMLAVIEAAFHRAEVYEAERSAGVRSAAFGTLVGRLRQALNGVDFRKEEANVD